MNHDVLKKLADKKFEFFRDARHMARDVMDCFLKILEEEGQMTSGDAQVYLKKMEQQKRYQADVWS